MVSRGWGPKRFFKSFDPKRIWVMRIYVSIYICIYVANFVQNHLHSPPLSGGWAGRCFARHQLPRLLSHNGFWCQSGSYSEVDLVQTLCGREWAEASHEGLRTGTPHSWPHTCTTQNVQQAAKICKLPLLLHATTPALGSTEWMTLLLYAHHHSISVCKPSVVLLRQEPTAFTLITRLILCHWP